MSTLDDVRRDRKTPEETMRSVLNFLFNKGRFTESQYLDTRTDVNTREMFSELFFLRTLDEEYGCKAAKKAGDRLERLQISSGRMSRREAVTILHTPQPEQVTVLRGIEENIKEAAQKEKKR